MTEKYIKTTTQEIDCGKAIITEYFDSDGNLTRRDTEIVVDPEKLPKMKTEVNF